MNMNQNSLKLRCVTRRIVCRVTEDEFTEIDKFSKQNKISVSSLLRSLLWSVIADEKNGGAKK